MKTNLRSSILCEVWIVYENAEHVRRKESERCKEQRMRVESSGSDPSDPPDWTGLLSHFLLQVLLFVL